MDGVNADGCMQIWIGGCRCGRMDVDVDWWMGFVDMYRGIQMLMDRCRWMDADVDGWMSMDGCSCRCGWMVGYVDGWMDGTRCGWMEADVD